MRLKLSSEVAPVEEQTTISVQILANKKAANVYVFGEREEA